VRLVKEFLDMKRRLFFVSLCITAVGIAGIAAGTLRSHGYAKSEPSTGINGPQQTHQVRPDNPGTINGAVNPELIPDQAAYSVLFRFIANRQTDDEKSRIRAYIRQMGLGDQKCRSCPLSSEPSDKDIDALIAAAEVFQQRVGVLDRQVKEIKDRNWPNPSKEVMAQLTVLQRQKEVIVTEIVASLPGKLSADALEKVHRHTNERIKRKMKIVPGPANPPGGPGWRTHEPRRH
jgi:hypothetical protein